MADIQQNIIINIDVESGNVTSQLDQIDQKLSGLGKDVNLQSFQSVRSEIAAAREEAVRLAIAIEQAEDAGQNVDELSQSYTEVTRRAAELRDAVDKTNTSISNARPDNRLQGLISIAQGAALAVQGIAGAFTILGVDAETANLALAKLQGIIAITSSLSSIDEIVDGYKDLKAAINLSAIAQRASNLATIAAAAIQKAFTGSVLATGGAFRLLKIAIASTGIGLLVVAIGFAVSKIMEWVDASGEAEEATSQLADEVDRLAASYQREANIQSRANQRQISELKARGATEKEINAARIEGLEEQARLAEENFQKIEQRRRTSAQITEELQGKIDKAREDVENASFNLAIARNEIRANDLKQESKYLDDKTSLNKGYIDNTKNDLRELNDFIEQQRLEQKRLNQTDLQNEIDNVDKKYKRLIDLAKVYKRDTAELEKLRSAEIARITSQALLQGLSTEREIVIKQIELIFKYQFDQISRFRQKSIGDQKKYIKSQSEVSKKLFEEGVDLFEMAKKSLTEFNVQEQIAQIKKLTLSPDAKINKERQDAIIESIEKTFELEKANLIREAEALKKERAFVLEAFRIDISIEDAEKKLEQLARSVSQTVRALDSGPLGRQRIELEKTIQNLTAERGKIIESLEFKNQLIDEYKAQELTKIKGRYENLTELELKISAKYRKDIRNLDQETANYRAISMGKAAIEMLETDFEIGQKRIAQQKSIAKEFSMTSTLVGEQIQPSFTRSLMGDESRKRFDDSLLAIKSYYDEEKNLANLELQRRLADTTLNQNEIERLKREHTQRLVQIEQDYNNDINALNLAQLEARLQLYDAIGGAIGEFGRLVDQLSDKQTKIGKATAIAEIAIQTATGFARGLTIAQQTAAAAGPGAAFAVPVFYAQQVAIVLSAARRAAQILQKVPGGGGGSSTSVPQAPSAINSNVFRLPPEAQNVRVVNQQQQVVRAFITNEDLRTAQEKAAFLSKLTNF
jgi:hypothetical protein